MKLDLSRSLSVPFQANTRQELLIIYLVAFGITLFPNIINMVMNFVMQMGMAPIFAFANSGGEDSIFSSAIGIVIIGVAIVLMLISFLIGFAAYLFPLGYIVETIRLEAEGYDIVMPMWEGNIKRILWNGLRLIGIVIIYSIIEIIVVFVPIIIIVLIALIINGGKIPSSAELGVLVSIAVILLTIFMVLIILVFSLIFPMIIVNFAVKQRFWAAFNFKEILSKIFSNLAEYLLAILLAILYSFVLMIPFFILCCTCIGTIFIPLLTNFIFPIMVLNLFAQLYKPNSLVIKEEAQK